MKKRILDLFVVYLAVISLLLQTISPIFSLTAVANAQEAVNSEPSPVVENITPESTSTQVTETQTAPTNTDIQSPDASIPPENITPVPTIVESTITLGVTQVETTTSSLPNENSPPEENSSTSPSSASLAPVENAPDPTGKEDINIVILENVSAPSIDLGVIEPENSATLTTDKGDYAPTDTALITGTGLNTNTDYTLRIWSDNAPATSSEVKITSSGDGTFVYAYQLDGSYRPNYSAELKDSTGNSVASTTFTDSAQQTEVRACMADSVGPVGSTLNCTANDVSIAAVNNIQILDDGCTSPGDTVTFNATWEVKSQANERYDVGLYFASQGQNNAQNGTCSVTTLADSPSPWSNLEGNKADACGDIAGNTTLNPSITITATCNPDPTTGKLKLPYCTSWDNNTNDTCNGPADAKPGTTSKCKCDSGFTVDIPVPPAIEVIKNIVPSNDLGKFDLQVNSITKKPNAGNTDSTGKVGITTGQNTFGELGGTGTILSDYSSDASCVLRGTQTPVTTTKNNGSWTIENVTNGQDIVCTITNTLQNGDLTIIKHVVGGNDPASSWNMLVRETPSSPNAVPAFPGSETGTTIVLPLNTYTVTEQGIENYTLSYSGDCNAQGEVTLTPGIPKTCTLTNTRDTGSLKVNKLVDTNGDGTFETTNPGNFTWSVDGTGTNTMGTGVSGFTTGTHSINENNVSDYHPVTWYITADNTQNCSNSNRTLPANIIVNKDQTSEITICNARDTGTVIVHKDVQGPIGEVVSDTSTNFTVDLDGSNSQNIKDGDMYTYTNVPTGDHTVHETNVSPNYTLYGISLTTGTEGSTGGLSFSVNKDQTTHVYVTNRQKKATITVEKIVLDSKGKPISDHQTFSVELNGSNRDNGLADDHKVEYIVNPGGPYGITEIPNGSYDYLGCKLPNQEDALSFSPKSNESITITCTNQQKPGSISGYKYKANGTTPIENWRINLFSCDSNFLTCGANAIATTLTNASGFYSFTDLITGFYRVFEELRDEFTPVGVTTHDVTINSNTQSTENNFSNFENVSVTACKLVDADGNLTTTNDQTDKFGWKVNLLTDGQVTETQDTGDDGCYTWTNLGPGHTYNVSENIPTGWTALKSTQSSFGPAVDGVNKSFTFINTQLGTIIVKKVMVGGTSSFSFTGDIAGAISANNGTISVSNKLPGTYTSVEGIKTGWGLDSITCNDTTSGGTASTGNVNTRTSTFNLDAGETVICTFTNSKLPTLTVNKVLTPSNDPGKFNLQIDEQTAGTGANVGNGGTTGAQTLSIGTHNVRETEGTNTLLSNYTAVISGNCAANGNITLSAGQNATCTITNTRNTGTIELKKIWSGSGGQTTLRIGTTQNGSEVRSQLTGTNGGNPLTTGQRTVSTGTYYVSETGGLTNYDSGLVCTDNGQPVTPGAGNSLTISKNHNIVCTFTNTRHTGTITIIKDAQPSSEDNFSFDTSSSFPGGDFELEDDGSDNNGGTEESKTVTVPTGQYWVEEDGETGWALTNLVCSDQNSTVNLQTGKATINIEKDEAVTCTFTNKKLATLIIKKDSTPNSDENFSFTRSFGGDFELEDDGNDNNGGTEESISFNNLIPGNYTVTENNKSGWSLTEIVCSDQTQPNIQGKNVTVSLEFGETVTCTFKNLQLGIIYGEKYNDKNGNNRDDSNEEDLSGWTIFIDENYNEELDNEETSTITNYGGDYSFNNLMPGEYRICEVQKSGWYSSLPNQATCQSTTINTNGGDVDEVSFGNREFGSIRVCKVIVDAQGNLSNGSELPGVNFQINWTGGKGLAPTIFTSGYTPNTQIFSDSEGNDAYCTTYSDIPLDNYGYSEEIISELGWETPKYNDQFNSKIMNLNDFYPYKQPGNENANGYMDLTNQAGPNRTLVILNQYEYGTIDGYKWNDLNGNGIRDCELLDQDNEEQFLTREINFCENFTEPTLSGWTIELFKQGEEWEKVATTTTDEGGNYTFNDVLPGEYKVCEVQQTGWEQTFPNFASQNPNCHIITVGSNDFEGEVNFGNHNITPIIYISKLNNATTTKVIGDTVEYTIVVKLDEKGGPAENVEVTDLLPNGFKYQTGSWQSSRPGVNEPVYASPGEWVIGDMVPGEEVVLKYLAKIQDTVTNGTYFDVALAKGNPIEDTNTEILALAVSPGDTDPGTDSNFVGTEVAVTSNSTESVGYESTSTKEVLGASTVLPATGIPNIYVNIAILIFGIGVVTLLMGILIRRKYE